MPKTKQVKITPAKGRPMLSWVGKRPLRAIPALPAQHIETFDPSPDFSKGKNNEIWAEWPPEYQKGGLLFHGDNKEVLAHLLANGFRGKVNLIYIDPPFDSGADYVRKVELRGEKGFAKVNGETYTLGEQIQYTDIWANDNYLQFVFERLLILRELLDGRGIIALHCDHNVGYLLRFLLDEVFGGKGHFINEVIWQHAVIGAGRGLYVRLPKAHETILLYAKDLNYTFNTDEKQVRVPYKDRITKNLSQDENGFFYTRGRTGTDNPWSKDPKYLKTYVDIEKGKLVHDVWDDITTYRAQGDEYVGYPTQKPEQLIERIICLLSNPGDLVMDVFVGSGTTAAVAQKLGRRWIGCDINKGAIQTTSKRLQTIINEQIKNGKKHKQNNLEGMGSENDTTPEPSQLIFTVWRVNDYDLQIQHNEAVNLACEYIGVERKRGDAYFDGTLGKKLVKIVPFNHPLSPLDLDELKNELKSRPDEDRDVALVCLGMEIAAQSWVEDWNKHRGENVPNKVEIIELRTDPKYAGFIKHDPATAKVSIKRSGKKIKVEIKDFISPTIIKRLDMEQSLFKAKITDWRSQVDCVMIDTAYNGSVFNVVLYDVPEKKNDLVAGKYELSAPDGEDKVAVKIIDMLGEEVLVVK